MASRAMNRRDVLRGGAAVAAVPGLAAVAAVQEKVAPRATGDPWRGLKVGVASYTLRKLPVDAAIQAIRRVDLRYVSIKDFHLPLKSSPEERRTVARRFRDAGITPLSCGVINMTNDETAIRQAFEYARDAGIPTIVCSPDPASMPVLDRMVKEFDIRLAIHNHGPGDRKWPSPYDVRKGVQSYDRRIGLCIDVGHTARIGVDPARAIRDCRERLYDLHLKDVTTLSEQGGPIESGRGALDQRPILQALVEIRYPHLVGFEYEKDADDPVPGLSESVGYTKGLLAGIRG